MMTGIIYAVIGLVALGLIFAVVAKVSNIFKSVSPLIDAISKTDFDGLESEIATTPKSVSGMTSLCIPRITKDFPEFNWYEFKQKAENMLLSAFNAIEEEDASLIMNASNDLRSQVALIIDATRTRVYARSSGNPRSTRPRSRITANRAATASSSCNPRSGSIIIKSIAAAPSWRVPTP